MSPTNASRVNGVSGWPCTIGRKILAHANFCESDCSHSPAAMPGLPSRVAPYPQMRNGMASGKPSEDVGSGGISTGKDHTRPSG